jgi:hypothetical protein
MRRALLVLSSALLAACAAVSQADDPLLGPDNGADNPRGRAKLTELCTAFSTARCNEFETCQPAGFAAVYFSIDGCVADRTARCVTRYTSDAIHIHASQLKSCFDAYGTLSCADFVHFNNENNPAHPAACDAVPAGTRADGESCAFDTECAHGRCGGGDQCGTCSAKHPAGDICHGDDDCVAGLGCGSDGKCAARANVGESCKTSPCHAPLSCIAGVCAAPIADGKACDPTIGFNACDWSNGRECDVTSRTCQTQDLHGIGQECGYTLDNGAFRLRGQCEPGLRCALNAIRGVCVAETQVGEGCFFAGGPDGAQCEHGATCVAGRCVAKTAASCKDFHATPAPSGPNPGKLPVISTWGGPVLRKIQYVTVTLPGYPYQDHVRALDEYTATSGWLETVGADYGVKEVEHTASIALSDGLTGTVSNEQLQDFLVSKIEDGSLPMPSPFDPDHAFVYALYVPKEVTVAANPFGTTCKGPQGYHDVVAFPYQFAYTVVANCPARSGLTEAQMIDTIAPHELIEAATDPGINLSTAFYLGGSPWEQTGGENADFCEGSYLEEGGFLMPRIWSNTNAVAGLDPCLPHLPDNPSYYNVVSDLVASAPPGGTATLTLTGWTSGPRADWVVNPRNYGGSLTLDASAITVDKPNINAGQTVTLSVAIPASAQKGSSAVIGVWSQ